jgi:preprotein translocase subunit SecF
MTIHMNKKEDGELNESGKIIRFGCGAIFGVLLGILIVVRIAFSSFGAIAAVIAFSFLYADF